MLINTSPAAAAQHQFDINYIPQFLMWEAAAAPLTNLRIEEQNEGVLVDLPAAAVVNVCRFSRLGVAASTFNMLRLANGHIKNKNVTITAIIAAAVAVPFYASSDAPGNIAFKYQTAALLAGQPMTFDNFSALFLPALAAGDTVFVEFDNGHQQLFSPEELLELAALYQTAGAVTDFVINNLGSYIKKATVTEAIAGAAYVMKLNI